MKILSLSAFFLLLPLTIYSQTLEERQIISSFSDKIANQVQSVRLLKEENARKIRLNHYLKLNPTVRKVTLNSQYKKSELMDVLPNGEFIYAMTDNAGAATTARATSLYSGGNLGLNIQGQNMIAGMWDGDNARSTHREFVVGGISKISNEDGNSLGNHATHVAGTIAAQGIQANLKGVAFNSSIKSYNWDADLSEMLYEASTGMLTSNHSYGFGALGQTWNYGAYDSRAKEIDAITFSNPYYLPVFSAGNSRNNNPIANPSKGGYDLVEGHANAKNVLSVAAVSDVPNYVDEYSVSIASFSSYGPSDDGRIKPDISMKGVSVISTTAGSDTAFGTMSGTSMASPGVTAGVLLLQQYNNQLYSSFLKAQAVKGLILHTADEAGYTPGPDSEFGWGLINLENAAKIIRDKNLLINPSVLQDETLSSESTFTKTISASGTQPLKVSISWTDPASITYNNGTIDPNSKYLVNDLDIKVTSALGTVYYPWKLQGMSDPSGQATNSGPNNVDNFERVDIANPSGVYTITVSHKGVLLNGSQGFTLIASAENLGILSTTEVDQTQNQISIYPNPVQDVLYLKNISKNSGTVTILDQTGRVIRKEELRNNSINVSNLISGNYMLLYKSNEDKQVSFKFIKN